MVELEMEAAGRSGLDLEGGARRNSLHCFIFFLQPTTEILSLLRPLLYPI